MKLKYNEQNIKSRSQKKEKSKYILLNKFKLIKGIKNISSYFNTSFYNFLYYIYINFFFYLNINKMRKGNVLKFLLKKN